MFQLYLSKMSTIEFVPVDFTHDELMLILHSEHPDFSIPLLDCSEDGSSDTIIHHSSAYILSKWVFDEFMTMPPSSANGFFGVMLGANLDPHHFFSLCQELIYKNMRFAQLQNKTSQLTDISGRLDHFICIISSEGSTPCENNCHKCFDVFFEKISNDILQIEMLPFEEQRSAFLKCKKSIVDALHSVDWMIAFFNAIAHRLDKNIERVDKAIVVDYKTKHPVFVLENTPAEFAAICLYKWEHLKFVNSDDQKSMTYTFFLKHEIEFYRLPNGSRFEIATLRTSSNRINRKLLGK